MEPFDPQIIRKRLHDGLCQQITAALMFADALRRTLADRDAPELADAERLVDILRTSADEMINVMGLLPPSHRAPGTGE